MSADPSVEIRPAVAADRDAMQALYRRSSLSNDGDRPILLEHPEVLELPDTAVQGDRGLVAIVAGTIAGYATIAELDDHLELEGLFVDPDRMRSGIASALVAAVVTTARERDIDRVEVVANPHALEFYEHVGFVADGPVETRFYPAERMHLNISR